MFLELLQRLMNGCLHPVEVEPLQEATSLLLTPQLQVFEEHLFRYKMTPVQHVQGDNGCILYSVHNVH